MQMQQVIAAAPRTRALAVRLAQLSGPCIGCSGCQGLCQSLIETLTLPEILLDRGAAP